MCQKQSNRLSLQQSTGLIPKQTSYFWLTSDSFTEDVQGEEEEAGKASIYKS